MMDWYGLLYAARTVWGEARGESQEGKIAVAWVIRNRFESGKWFAGKTIKETVLKPHQFSCWNENDPNRRKVLNVALEDESLLKCLYAVLQVFLNLGADPTGGATHYYAASMNTPPQWAEGKTPFRSIGNHVFFNDVD